MSDNYSYGSKSKVKKANQFVKPNPLIDFTAQLSEIVGYRSNETEENKMVRSQKLDELPAQLKKMERDYDSDDEAEYNLISNNFSSSINPGFMNLINRMQLAPASQNTVENKKISLSSTKGDAKAIEYAESKTDSNNNNLQLNAQEQSIKDKERILNNKTYAFFRKSAQWKEYPKDKLTPRHTGHKVFFFTMASHEAVQAETFTQDLKKAGFEAVLRKANDKPSIVVDLTESRLTI